MTSQATNKISTLKNSIHFYIHKAIIIELEEGASYRLVVMKPGTVQIDMTYSTLRGARIAFSKLFANNHYEEGNKVKKKPGLAKWSRFYISDTEWLSHWMQPEKKEKD